MAYEGCHGESSGNVGAVGLGSAVDGHGEAAGNIGNLLPATGRGQVGSGAVLEVVQLRVGRRGARVERREPLAAAGESASVAIAAALSTLGRAAANARENAIIARC